MSLPKAWMSWSTGKDSAWALHKVRLEGLVEITGLLTTLNQAFSRVAMHAVREELLKAQAEAVGLPLVKVPLPWPCPNAAYEEAMEQALAQARSAGVSRVVFGDLFLEDIRKYREEKMAGTGLTPLTKATAGGAFSGNPQWSLDGSKVVFESLLKLDGSDVTGRRPEDMTRAGVAHVPEGQGVITELTVAENLQLGLLLRPRRDRAAALAELYERFGALADRKNKAAGTLSGGERQMLVIARALATNPRVLLLDEPSLGLAPKIVSAVLDLIKQLKEDTNLTIILVEQNARSALEIADTGVVLNLGAVVATAPARQLAADEALRRHYLGF